jgi:ribosomal protein S27AE
MNSVKPPGQLSTPTRTPAPETMESSEEATTCPRCGESRDLAKVKGCIKCLKCGFKFDCNGW